jgi:hypothetical protein
MGRSLFLIFTKFKYENHDKKEVFGLPYYFFYILISIFFVGNLQFLLNFFLPGKVILRILYFIAALLIIYNIRLRFVINLKSLNLYVQIFIPICLSISSYGMWLHYDAGLYHLNHQLWINESKIVFGLSNLNIWYSWSSIYEYLSSLLWLENNFIQLHYLNLIFFCVLFSFLSIALLTKKNLLYRNISIAILIFSILDNFGINGGNNGFITIQTIGKPDVAFGVLFFLATILIFNSIVQNSMDSRELLILTLFQVFLIQLKTFGYFFSPLYLFYLYKLVKKEKENIKLLLINVLPPAVILFFWYIKNIITTGCILFPIENFCFSQFSWYEKGTARSIAIWGRDIPRVYKFDQNFFEWFRVWYELDHNKQVFPNLLITVLAIFIFKIIFLSKQRKKESKYFLIFILFLLFSWLSTGASVRYGFGIWLLIVSSIMVNSGEFKLLNFTKLKYLLAVSLVSSCLLIPRIYSYQEMINRKFNAYTLPIENFTYVSKENSWGVRPLNTEKNLCWVKLDCIESERTTVELSEFLGYKIFLNK